LGTWLRIGNRDGTNGVLVWKTETRNAIFGNLAPRDLGFNTGSALSTANYKELDWGITDLYWKQRFQGSKHAFLVGHMDPGDWADQYPLLNAWTSFVSDAFYNNPSEAIPKRGFGLVGQSFLTDKLYLAGGVHDANGGDGELKWDSFWGTREWFSWVELGYRTNHSVSARHNSHIHYWHQDAREEAGTQESRGLAYTYSYATKKDGVAFIRAGYSKGDAAQMRRFIGGGMSYKPKGRDTLGIATSWGSPPDKSLRNQITSEIFYRVQVTQNLTFTPSLQVTFKPSFTLETKWLYVPGLRMRLVF
jgi:porin